jgi:hypothetical protein
MCLRGLIGPWMMMPPEGGGMAIIFGWGGGTPRDQGPALPMRCPNCNNSGFFRYMIVRKWFRLYFIPVIPYETRHFLMCPVCTGGIELTGGDRARVARMTQMTASWNAGGLTEGQYLHLVRAFLSNEPLELPAATQPALASGTSSGSGRPYSPKVDEGLAETPVEHDAEREIAQGAEVPQANPIDGGERTGVVRRPGPDPRDLPPPPGPSRSFCTTCGAALLTDDARFCHVCGAPSTERRK